MGDMRSPSLARRTQNESGASALQQLRTQAVLLFVIQVFQLVQHVCC
jgi:hypothetical protein